MNLDEETSVLEKRLIPPVKSLSLVSGDFCEIAKATWHVEPREGEAYSICVRPEEIIVRGNEKNARKTLRQLEQVAHNKRVLPCVEIEDEPEIAWRGIHLCWFPEPEMSAVEIEKQIRIAAYLKFNYIVLESWGAIRYDSHPEFCWDNAAPISELRRLAAVAREAGALLIPQLNLFGHASLSRSVSGKHALLDRHPEFEGFFEPGGWCWCLSNPATRRFLADIVEELYDACGRPGYFHFGCDEADDAGTCPVCRRHEMKELLHDHLTYFADLLGKDCRPMVWHDMFLSRADKRWDGFIVNGADFSSPDDVLDKRFIICDWQYYLPRNRKEGEEVVWATSLEFKRLGYDVALSPWENCSTRASLAQLAAKENFAFLQTVWHHGRGRGFMSNFILGAADAWAPSKKIIEKCGISHFDLLAAHFTRQIVHEMGVTDYKELGFSPMQLDTFPLITVDY